MSISSGLAAFELAMTYSPIILTGGITTSSGGAVPIINYINPSISLRANSTGLISTVTTLSQETLDSQFAKFMPAAGGTLISNQAGTYPYANQSVAANAIIRQPTNQSMMMQCPATATYPFGLKQTTITSLVQTLSQHNNLGGTYTLVTPAYVYTNGIMLQMQDVSGGESKQAQYLYRLDFYFPLVSLAQAQQALNGLMNTLTSALPTNGTPSWGNTAALPVGNPTQLATRSITPSAVTPSVPPQPFVGNHGF